MKSKAPLALMEQLIMLLVFALAAALCLQVFALSGSISQQIETRDRAATAVQNAAEAVKICRGDTGALVGILGGACTQTGWQQCYDSQWQPTAPDTAVYFVTVLPADTSSPLLGSATVCAAAADGQPIFQLTVAWQEASHE